MILVLQTEEENEAYLAAIAALMDKAEENLTPNEGYFLEITVPIIEAYEKQLYGRSHICLECAKSLREEQNGSKVTLDKVLSGRKQSEATSG